MFPFLLLHHQQLGSGFSNTYANFLLTGGLPLALPFSLPFHICNTVITVNIKSGYLPPLLKNPCCFSITHRVRSKHLSSKEFTVISSLASSISSLTPPPLLLSKFLPPYYFLHQQIIITCSPSSTPYSQLLPFLHASNPVSDTSSSHFFAWQIFQLTRVQ